MEQTKQQQGQQEMHTKVVGVSMGRESGEDRQLNIKQLNPGQKLYIIYETTNPFDPNAIKLFADPEHRKPLGYIARELSRDIATQRKEHGYEYEFIVAQVTGGAGKTLGLNIKIQARRKEQQQTKTDGAQ